METRKIQVSGGSSYIVSLPKEWIKSNNIQKNDPVRLDIQQDGTLLINPNTESRKVEMVKVFEVSPTTDRTQLLRYLIGAYIAGCTTIRITAPGRLPPFVAELVREFTGMAIGQEVIEETNTLVVLKDLLNPAEMPFESTLRRMLVIVQGMHEDALTALEEGDSLRAENVIRRDNDVDRLHWLIARQFNLIIGNVNLSGEMGVTVSEAAGYFLISRIIERIGDHATKIAKNVIHLTEDGCTPEITEIIGQTGYSALRIFNRSIGSFFDRDIEKANSTIEMVGILESDCREIGRGALDFSPDMTISVVHIADSLRRVGDYSADICEAVINQLVMRKA